MNFKQSGQLTLFDKIHYSWRSPIVGFLVLSSWAGSLYWLYITKKDFPIFIIILNMLIYPFFLFYLVRQIKVRLIEKKEKFLMGFTHNQLALALHIAEMKAANNENLYLILDKSEITKIVLIKESRLLPKYKNSRIENEVIFSNYLKITVNTKNITELTENLIKVNVRNGYVGSSLFLSSENTIHFYLDGHRELIKKVEKKLQVYFSGFLGKSSKQDVLELKNLKTFEDIKHEATRLWYSGRHIEVNQFLNYLVFSKNISKEQQDLIVNSLPSQKKKRIH